MQNTLFISTSIKKFFLCVMLLSPFCAAIHGTSIDLYEKISDQYTDAFGSLKEDAETAEEGRVELSEREKRLVVFEALLERERDEKRKFNTALSPRIWRDLNFFSGEDDRRASLAMLLNKGTRTVAGEVVLNRILAQPTTNIQHLINRQNAIKELIDNEELSQRIKDHLKQVKEGEEPFLSFWYARDKEVFEPLIKGGSGWKMRELKRRIADAFKLFTIPTAFVLLTTLGVVIGFAKLVAEGEIEKEKVSSVIKAVPGAIKEAVKAVPETVKAVPKAVKVVSEFVKYFLTAKEMKEYRVQFGTSLAFYGAIQAYYTYQYLPVVKLSKKLRQKLNAVSSCINAMDALVEEAKSNEHLHKAINLKGVSLDELREKSAELDTLLNHLESSAVQGPSHLRYFFSFVGKAYAAYNLMLEVKDLFAPLLEAVGEIDAYQAVAKFYHEHAGHERAPWCFAQYLDQNIPEIDGVQTWNPFLDQDKVVANDIQLGARFGSANALIKGSNAQGKSTLLKSIMLNSVLALTFGVAAAREMRLTPFAKFSTHLNIVDVVGAKSLYQAEVIESKRIADTIEGLKKDELCLTIADEMFNSTNPQEGSAAFLGYWNYLSQKPTSLSVVASHFPLAPLLSDITDNKFKNYNVAFYRLEDAHYTYTGKLIPYEVPMNPVAGYSNFVAINILIDFKLNPAITAFALDVVNNPGHYPTPHEVK